MITEIDKFLSNPLPVPKNERGRLGVIGGLLVVPFSGIAIFAGGYEWILVWLAVTMLLLAPYFLIIQLIFFTPIFISILTPNLERWVEETIGFTVLTMICILLGSALMFWKIPKTDVAIRFGNGKEN